MPLHLRRPISEKNAQELKRKETKVEVHGSEEREEDMERRRSGEEDIRIAKARVVSDGLKSKDASTSARAGAKRGTYPSVHFLDLAQQAKRLDDCLGYLDVFGCIFLKDAKEDWESSRADFLLTRRSRQHAAQHLILPGCSADPNNPRYPLISDQSSAVALRRVGESERNHTSCLALTVFQSRLKPLRPNKAALRSSNWEPFSNRSHSLSIVSVALWGAPALARAP